MLSVCTTYFREECKPTNKQAKIMSKRGQRTPWATQGTPRDCRGGVQISSAAASAGQTLSQRKSQGDRPRES